MADQLPDLATPVEASSGQEWQYEISTVRALILADQLANLAPIEASSGQEWQYEISSVRAHIGRSTEQIYHTSRGI